MAARGLEKRKKKMTKRQRTFIDLFVNKCACNISATCNQMSMSRRNYYKWIDQCPEFKEEIEMAQDTLIDMAETKLQQNIAQGKEASIFFFLKTKGKDRGYIETIENRVQVNEFEEAMKNLPDPT